MSSESSVPNVISSMLWRALAVVELCHQAYCLRPLFESPLEAISLALMLMVLAVGWLPPSYSGTFSLLRSFLGRLPYLIYSLRNPLFIRASISHCNVMQFSVVCLWLRWQSQYFFLSLALGRDFNLGAT